VKNDQLLEIKKLKVGFRQSDGGFRNVVHGLDLTVGRGEAVGLVGESGSGKSVTALAVMRLLGRHGSITEGEILLNGTDLARLPDKEMRALRGKEISMIFQDPTTALNPAFTIGTQLVDVIEAHQHFGRNRARKEALQNLDHVGFRDPARALRAYPHELSGGMKQRAMVAMAVACKPRIVLADEPTTALDVTVQAQIVALLRRLVKELDIGLLFITHNLDLMGELCTRAAVMHRGHVVETASAVDLFERPQHQYTRMLFESIPRLELV